MFRPLRSVEAVLVFYHEHAIAPTGQLTKLCVRRFAVTRTCAIVAAAARLISIAVATIMPRLKVPVPDHARRPTVVVDGNRIIFNGVVAGTSLPADFLRPPMPKRESEPPRRRLRRPTLSRALAEAAKNKTPVRGATIRPDGSVRLEFGDVESTDMNQNEWDKVLPHGKN
jgi:hypothetical protein